MSENPKLSIITVNLNNRYGLQRTIDSVVSQTFTDYEWIVIDGGSTDGSRELIEQYQDHFAYWCSEPDKGIYNAMNKGITHAKGEWLQFLNSGDWLYNETTLKSIFHENHNGNEDFLYGNYIATINQKVISICKPDNQISLNSIIQSKLGHNATFIKKTTFNDSLYNEKYKIVSDWEFFIKQAILNKKFKYINTIVSCFDKTGISSTDLDLVTYERNQVINSIIPKAILLDLKHLNEITEGQIEEIRVFQQRGKFFKNIISFSVYFMRVLYSILCFFSMKTRKNNNNSISL